MPVTQRRKLAFAAAIVGAAILVAAGAWYWLAPKPEVDRAEAEPAGAALKTGAFQDGDALHHASGTVRIVESDTGRVLRFDDYDATSGPAVYIYLTPTAHATTANEVEAQGVRILAPSGTGEATLRGDFNIALPADVDVSAYGGVAIWCERFDVLFGYAELASE